MLLAVDVGNTSINFGIFAGKLRTFRLETSALRQKNLPARLLKSIGKDFTALEGVAIASVVPWADPILKKFCLYSLGLKPYFIDPSAKLPIRNLYKNPKEVGADRIVNAVAAWAKFRKPAVVVDFGTATTFDCITGKGEYAGGLIVPGPDMASESLQLKTAKLPFVRISKPRRLIGKNTNESIQAGLFYGYVSLVDGILDRLITKLGKNCQLLATGGLAPLIAGSSHRLKASSVDLNLTLEGIAICYKNVTKSLGKI